MVNFAAREIFAMKFVMIVWSSSGRLLGREEGGPDGVLQAFMQHAQIRQS
jgi:hypothetical protein